MALGAFTVVVDEVGVVGFLAEPEFNSNSSSGDDGKLLVVDLAG